MLTLSEASILKSQLKKIPLLIEKVLKRASEIKELAITLLQETWQRV